MNKKPVDPDARKPYSLRLRPSLVAKLDKAAPDWRGQAETYLEELAAGRGQRALSVGAGDELKLLKATPKPVAAQGKTADNAPAKTAAPAVQFGPTKSAPGARLKVKK